MKKKFIYIKGILLGFVSIAIPGLSASTIALILNIYYDMIDAISNIFKKFKSSFFFLLILILGFATGGFLGALSIDTVYSNYPLIIILMITGFILGGVPKMVKDIFPYRKKISGWIVFIVITSLLIIYSYVITEGSTVTFDNLKLADYIVLFFVGILASATLVIPGMDFAMLFLALGYYSAFVGLIADLPNIHNFVHNMSILGVYLVGYGIGTFAFSKIIKIIINKYEIETRYASLAFVISAPAIVIKKCIIENSNFSFSLMQLFIGVILFIIGFCLIFVIPIKAQKNTLQEEVEHD